MAFTGPSGDNRLNYARHSRFIRTIGQSIMYQAYLWLYQGGSLTLFQYLNSLPKGLNGLEKHTVDDIKAERDLTNMDITSLYKVMQRACGLSIEDRAWYTKPKSEKDTTLEQALHQLKLERNKLLHKDPTTFIKVSDSELDSAMALLKTLYRNILVLAAEKGKVEPNTLKVAITKMEEDLRQERYSESGITESEFLKISVQDLTEKNQEEGLESFPSEYVEVRLSKENQDISPSQIPLKDLLVQTCKEGDKPQVMVVVGETGAGKTSLCQYMMSSWLSRHSSMIYLSQYQLVLPFHCSSVNTRDIYYLLRFKILPNATFACDSGSLIRILSNLRVLWLVDGWDEATQEARCLLKELLTTQSPSHTVLITSRPELSTALTNDTVFTSKFLRFSLLGLDNNEKGKLLQKKESEFSSHKRSISEFVDHMGRFAGLVQEELKNPLKLLLMARLWCENSEFQPDTSLIKLYMRIKEVLIKQLVEKLAAEVAPGERDAEEQVDKWLRCFCKITFNSMKKGPILRIDSKDLKKLKEECRIVRDSQCLSTFLNYHPSNNGKGYYTYLHYSHQCFYAALHVVLRCSQARDPETEINKMFQPYIRKSSDYINPCLGIYDIVLEILILFMIVISKLSFGWIGSRVNRTEFSQKLQQLFRKLTNLATGTYFPREDSEDTSNMSKYHPVLLQLLEMQALKYFTSNISARSLANMLFLSLDEEGDPPKWFEVLQRCHYHEDLVKEAARRVDTKMWIVTDGDLKAARELMVHIMPNELVISINGDPKKLADLEIVLYLVARKKVKVHLHLHWHYASIGLKNFFSDEHLSLLCDNSPKCWIVSFMGHLSSRGVMSLAAASRMELLFIRVSDGDTVNHICSATQNMKSLQRVDLVYDLRKFIIPCSSLGGSIGILKFIDGIINILMFKRRKSLNFSLFLPHLNVSAVNPAVDFISGLSKHYGILSVDQLDHKGVKKLVIGLEKNGVRVAKLVKSFFNKEIKKYIRIAFTSLPLQIPLKDLVQHWHDANRSLFLMQSLDNTSSKLLVNKQSVLS